MLDNHGMHLVEESLWTGDQKSSGLKLHFCKFRRLAWYLKDLGPLCISAHQLLL
jgi:hypothetical protein